MKHETFNKLLDTLESSRVTTLKEKNARYSDPEDALHNFSQGAEIMGCTPAQCAWNYATKHIVALRDMIIRNDFSNRADVLEKSKTFRTILVLFGASQTTKKQQKHCQLTPPKKLAQTVSLETSRFL